METYEAFLQRRAQLDNNHGFEPVWLPDFLFGFQRALVEWATRKGRALVLADCGLGKTPLQLVWAENVVRKTNGRVLILTPLAVAPQTVREAEKFGIEARRSPDGTAHPGISVTNYDRLSKFDPNDFVGVVCDESGILKAFNGVRRAEITEFMRRLPYRLLCSATAAPNDYVELGTSSEALGQLGYMDMLSKFFKNDQNSNHPNRIWAGGKWRFRGHAEHDFWRWVVSWARALRKPSDLGFSDDGFVLPPLIMQEHVVQAKTRRAGFLFDLPAVTLEEQRDERRRTLRQRCERAAELVMAQSEPSVAWCQLNDEGDALAEMIPDAVQISGSDSDEKKEEAFIAFAYGGLDRLITKTSLAGLGLNWQRGGHQIVFPSNSFEQFYQGVRRQWRFGRKGPVTVDVVTSEGEARVLANLKRKSEQADIMFARLIEVMSAELQVQRSVPFTKSEEVPSWLS